MARLMALAAERPAPGTAVAERVLGWEGDVSSRGQSVPLRLAGALHAVKRAGHAGLGAVYPPAEVSGAALRLQVWPRGDRLALGRADFHGRWIEWSTACLAQ